jgi:hypothetical protein
MISPVFKAGTVGFLTGSLIPILFTSFYLIPSQQYMEQREINWLKKVVSLMNWQVNKLESRQFGTSLSEGSYRDGLYWAGF